MKILSKKWRDIFFTQKNFLEQEICLRLPVGLQEALVGSRLTKI